MRSLSRQLIPCRVFLFFVFALAVSNFNLSLSLSLSLVIVWAVNNEQSIHSLIAAIAQLGERQTEDLKVPGSIPGLGIDSFGHSHICFSILNILQLLLHPFFLCLSLSLSPSLLLAYIHVLLFHSFAKLQCALEMQSSGHMV